MAVIIKKKLTSHWNVPIQWLVIILPFTTKWLYPALTSSPVRQTVAQNSAQLAQFDIDKYT
ncbi:hypothetical protein [Oceanobacillus chungangensis]|uniref:Uncharacterized protein n=1 Tax=Oceanobacillus chungangensis TaxID=1229152 RepID=A0A3D8Q013_9BACI|nr:hypothetical protein [Oceanobacillus chungangensis]RDW20759.1 hypothetical protein CWR45_05910 [Oceanobacillus chungangensis]